MPAQLIEYVYDGDKAAWREVVETFLAEIGADPVLRDGLTYQVFVRPDGRARLHVPHWRDEAVLAHLRGCDFFKTFSEAIQGFAGDTLKVTKPTLGT